MKLAAVTAIAMLLAGCASTPSGMSFNERLQAELDARTAQACGGKAGKAYYDCASGVRTEFFARGQYARAASFPRAENRGSEVTSRETPASNAGNLGE